MRKLMVIMVGIIALCLIASPAFALTIDLVSSGVDGDAYGTLNWDAIGTSFTGSLTVGNLDPGYNYQMKIEQDWTTPAGAWLSEIGRTWDDTVFWPPPTGIGGNTDGSLDGTAHAGAGAWDVHAANVGDYMDFGEVQVLSDTYNHDLVGYFLFDYFYIDTVGEYTFDFYADYSWHVADLPEHGDVTMHMGTYDSTFIFTRETVPGSTYDNIFGEGGKTPGIGFEVVPEPSTLLLLGGGLLGLAGLRRKFKI